MIGNKFFRELPLLKENLSVATSSIKSNKLRSSLTILIIAIGITSLVGILTATDILRNQLFGMFSNFGANSFTITERRYDSMGDSKSRIRNKKEITYSQALTLKENYDPSYLRTVYSVVNENAEVEYKSDKTNPTTIITAADSDYLQFKNIELNSGRGITENDILTSAYVCVIGNSIASKLFKKESPLDKIVDVNGVKYKIIGVAKEAGTRFGGGGVDQEVIIPISNGRAHFIGDNTSFEVGIAPQPDSENISIMYDVAEFIMRFARRLSPVDVTDFRLSKNEAMFEDMNQTMSTVTVAAAVIGLITLLGAAVGLMNIMLVSVKERTREIGTRKALGASSKRIKQQFLFESVIISQLGCVLGVVLGILAGNILALTMNASFMFPWLWVFLAICVCFLVGVLSGYVPAVRASKLDPIVALRYE